MESSDSLDHQVCGTHYRHPIQPIEFIVRNEIEFIAGNIIKYATRAPFKGQFKSDVEKIIHYAQLWLALEGDKYD